MRYVLLLFLCLQCFASAAKPNVLFIAVDDLNDWVGFLGGHPQARTPNLDRLAAKGVAFTNAHTASPVCAPSRVAFLSGQLPSTSGIYNNKQWWLPNLPNLVTLPAHFKANGYRVAGAGKLFHHSAGHNPPKLWDDFQPLVFHDNPWAHSDKTQFPFTPDQPDPPAFPYSGIELYSKEVDWGALDKAESEFDDARTAQYGIDFLQQSHSQPFFLACGIFRPHMPWYFPKKYLDLYPLEQLHIPEPPAHDLDDVPEAGKQLALQKYEDLQKTRRAGKWAVAVQHYLASISFADAQVGRLLEALEASPYADNTIVVLLSDHGWHLGEKSHWHKRTLWEEATRVPLIVSAPGVGKADQRCSQAVSLVDVFPTLMELCQLEAPRGQRMDGVSLVPWLKSPERKSDRAVITVHEALHFSARDNRYRYIRYKDGSEELYDHRSDANEWNNLAASPEHFSIKQGLARQLPQQLAPSAKLTKSFIFDYPSYTWKAKATGELIEGRR